MINLGSTTVSAEIHKGSLSPRPSVSRGAMTTQSLCVSFAYMKGPHKNASATVDHIYYHGPQRWYWSWKTLTIWWHCSCYYLMAQYNACATGVQTNLLHYEWHNGTGHVVRQRNIILDNDSYWLCYWRMYLPDYTFCHYFRAYSFYLLNKKVVK